MRFGRTSLALAVALPFAAALVACLRLRPEPLALVAPWLGPWAGVLFGHRECTLASVAPAPALALAGLGAAALAGVVALRPRPARSACALTAVVWAAAWELSALLSLANASG